MLKKPMSHSRTCKIGLCWRLTIKLARIGLPLLLTFFPVVGRAQNFTRAEVGLETSILRPNRLVSATDAGIGGRFSYNLTPSLALDSEFDSYFTAVDQHGVQDGGRATVFVAGVKAGIRKSKYGLFFKARPGIMSFGDVLTSASVFGSLTTARKTHAVLDIGAAGEFYPSRRTIFRLDTGRMLVRYGDSTDIAFSNGAAVRNIGRINAPWHIEAGFGYRIGDLRSDQEISRSPERFSLGVQYSLLTSERGFFEVVRDESGVGGWFTWNFSKYFSLDSSATYFPRLIHIADLQQGGKTFQAVAGLRAGVRRERFGVFGKLRPGIQGYTETVGNAITFIDSPFIDSALDAGGIIEVYTSRKTMLRFDAGDTSIYYRSRDVVTQTGLFHAPSFTNNTIQLTAGFGWRF